MTAPPLPSIVRGADLRSARERLGLTQAELATYLAATQAQVSGWEALETLSPRRAAQINFVLLTIPARPPRTTDVRISDELVAELRRRVAADSTVGAEARRTGLAYGTVWRAVTGRTFANLLDPAPIVRA